MGIGKVFYLLISHLHNTELALYKLLVQKQRRVILVVIIILFIWNCPVIANPVVLLFIHRMDGAPVNHRL